MAKNNDSIILTGKIGGQYNNKNAVGHGRPSKMNEQLLEIFKKIVDESILPCTQEDLFFLLNDKLIKENLTTISYSTFRDWKANSDSYAKKHPTEADLFFRFSALVYWALIKQKKRLMKELEHEPIQWRKWAWIMERKFQEWNLQQKVDVTSDGEKVKSGDIPALAGMSKDELKKIAYDGELNQ